MIRELDLSEISDGKRYGHKDMVKAGCNDCKGCSKCARNCPVGAISGQIKKPYVIDDSICIKCGACESACAFHAIHIEA